MTVGGALGFVIFLISSDTLMLSGAFLSQRRGSHADREEAELLLVWRTILTRS